MGFFKTQKGKIQPLEPKEAQAPVEQPKPEQPPPKEQPDHGPRAV